MRMCVVAGDWEIKASIKANNLSVQLKSRLQKDDVIFYHGGREYKCKPECILSSYSFVIKLLRVYSIKLLIRY